jgi:hypothetical protein
MYKEGQVTEPQENPSFSEHLVDFLIHHDQTIIVGAIVFNLFVLCKKIKAKTGKF